MKVLLLKQIRGGTIHHVDSSIERFALQGDAMITHEHDLGLMVYGADCANIVFWDDKKIGACHAGWQGYSLGLVKNMAEQFQGGYCYIAPFLHKFEIKRDYFYDAVTKYCGEKFFDFGDIITFDFRSAIMNELVGVTTFLDPRDTFSDKTLASNRRGYSHHFPNTQNRLAIWRHLGKTYYHFLKPSELSQEFFDNWVKNHRSA